MNKERRKKLTEIINDLNTSKESLEEVICEEDESRENMAVQNENYEKSEEYSSQMEDASSSIEDAINALEEVIQ